jgi:S-adenosylmethionine decarboxylase
VSQAARLVCSKSISTSSPFNEDLTKFNKEDIRPKFDYQQLKFEYAAEASIKVQSMAKKIPDVEWAHGGSSRASGSASRLQVPFFEGSEKRVEIHFVPSDPHSGDIRGLRQVPRSAWEQALSKAGITIESAIYGEHWDTYMLSESSLFVSPTRIICKTCGQSAPLEILEDALQHGTELGYQAKQVLFSRSDLLRPEEQPPVHRSFDAERDFLDQALPHAISTNAYTFGDADGAQWNMYLATLPTAVSENVAEAEAFPPTLEIACYGLEPTSSSVWWDPDSDTTPDSARFASGLSAVMPDDGTVDEMLFSPCGYSMNCFDQAGAHSTVHVTPQEGCSFASFEATILDMSTVNDTIRNVVQIFKPERFSVSLVEWDVASRHASSVDPTEDATFASQYTMGSQSSQRLTCGRSVGRHRFSSFESNDVETLATRKQEIEMPPEASVYFGQHGFKAYKYAPYGICPMGDLTPYVTGRTQDKLDNSAFLGSASVQHHEQKLSQQ